MKLSRLLAASLLLLLSTAAHAEEDGAAPTFTHLGPDGSRNQLGIDLAFLFNTEDAGEALVTRGAIGGQIIDPKSGFGGYGSIPFAWVSDDGESESALGSIEVGGLYHRVASEDVDVTLRAGLALPTVSDDQDGLFYYLTTLFQDPGDLITGLPSTTSFRLAATPIYHRETVYARADVGLDVLLDSDSGDDFGPLVHAHFAVGLAPRPVGASFELQNLCTTEDTSDRCLHLAAVAVQVGGKHGVGTIGLSHAFGNDDDFDDFVNLELGYRGTW